MINAPINRIIPFSVVDGPGNRTSIFLQGCNIQCGYCHNPETQKMCTACGLCVSECPANALVKSGEIIKWDEEKCIRCDHCIEVCKRNASPKIKWMSAQEVFAEVRKNVPFIRGITVSGGECMLYPEFLTELFQLAKKENLSTLIDSNGTIRFEDYPELMETCDGVMLDVKSWDKDVFLRLTGEENDIVKENLSYLSEINKIEEIRIVCLPDRVDAKEVLYGIQGLIGEKINSIPLKLISFRNYGVKGEFASLDTPTVEYMEELEKVAHNLGFEKIRLT